MTNYLTLVITASFFCTLISALMSEKGAGKTAKVVVNLVMLAVVILPVINGLKTFSNNISLPVINDISSHNIDNEEDDVRVYREWLAKTTALKLSDEIEESVLHGTGIKVRVECPWHFEGDSVVFDKLKIFTASDKRYHENIENYVKLHFSLDGECLKEVE